MRSWKSLNDLWDAFQNDTDGNADRSALPSHSRAAFDRSVRQIFTNLMCLSKWRCSRAIHWSSSRFSFAVVTSLPHCLAFGS